MITALKKQVKQVLMDDPSTRNSDITLMIEIWKRYYFIGDSVLLNKLYELPREDNCKRLRVKFCEDGYSWAMPTDWKVAKARKIKEDEWRNKLGYMPQKKTEYYEVDNKVIQVPEDKVTKFIGLNPTAKKLN